MDKKSLSRTAKIFCVAGSVLLLFMAAFHGSGISYVSDIMSKSNAEPFLKEIMPALFAHPSIHLIGLAAFGILAVFMTQDAPKVLVLLAIAVAADAALAFYLGGVIPGVLLMAAALCFGLAGGGLSRSSFLHR